LDEHGIDEFDFALALHLWCKENGYGDAMVKEPKTGEIIRLHSDSGDVINIATIIQFTDCEDIMDRIKKLQEKLLESQRDQLQRKFIGDPDNVA
jgi:hypothetical protein